MPRVITLHVEQPDQSRNGHGKEAPRTAKCKHVKTHYPDSERFDRYRPDRPFTIERALREVMR